MRKHFLKVSLIGLLAVSMPMSFTSCKDYDDDIEALENSNADLSNQLSALQAALTANQQAATAAQSAADAAKAAADAAQNSADAAAKEAAAAKQEAELAKKAAAEAKAEAIEEAIDQVKSMLSGYATSAQLATLAGTVEGIQKGLSTLEASLKEANAEIDENARAIEAIKVQVAALEKFQAETGKDITAIKADIEALKAQLNSKITKDEVNALLNEANAKLTKELNSAVSTLQGVISNRLSSITLVPNLYIDGIETIEFVSLQYENKDKADDVVLISTEENEVQYRLNPTTVGESDIDAANINFVALQATARGVVEAPIAFAKFNGIDKNGIMSIYAKKANTKSLNLGGNQIYTVAVEVPIAKDLCDAENPDQKVYSEYARLYEGVKVPHIAKKPYACPAGHADCADGAHYYDATIWDASVATDECVVKEVNYNETLDLRTLVTGCAIEEITLEDGTVKTVATQMTAEQLAKYGLEFRFEIPTKPYTTDATNETNQQVFGALKEDGYTIYSKLPNNITDNRAAIDKQPIVEVELFDVKNNKVADRRYFKIKWTVQDPVEQPNIETIVIAEVDFGQEILPCDAATIELGWDFFINYIYAKVLTADIQVPNEDGTALETVNRVVKPDMSFDKFKEIYCSSDPYIEVIRQNAEGEKGYGAVQLPVIDSDVEADAHKLTWTLNADTIGTIVKLKDHSVKPHGYDLVNNYYIATITWTPKDLQQYAPIQLVIKRSFKLGSMPEFFGFYENYWMKGKMGEVYPVYPVQYGTPAQEYLGNEKCVFHNNIMNAFRLGSNGLMFRNGLGECSVWDMQFCYSGNTLGYKAGYDNRYQNNEPDTTGVAYSNNTGDGAYTLKSNVHTVATLDWPDNHTSWCKEGHKEIYVDLLNNNSSWAMLTDKDDPTVFTHLGIWTTVNPYNVIPAHDFDICFIEPLDIKTAEIKDVLYDGVVNGDAISWRKVFQLKDCFGYLVSEAPDGTYSDEKSRYTASLFDYYGVVTPSWVPGPQGDDDKYYAVDVRFGFTVDDKGNIVVNPNATVDNAMTVSDLMQYTSGGSIPSLKVPYANPDEIRYFSNMGSQVSGEYKIWAKVTISYLWGERNHWVPITVKPMQAD